MTSLGHGLVVSDHCDHCSVAAAVNDAQMTTRLAAAAAAVYAGSNETYRDCSTLTITRCVSMYSRYQSVCWRAVGVRGDGRIVGWQYWHDMSLRTASDGVLMEESKLGARSAVSRDHAAANDAPFYSATSRKSAPVCRVVNRSGRSATEPTRCHGPGTTTCSTSTTGRQSLLGRPVSARPSRRDARYRRCQVAVYNFLERPKNWPSILYHLFVWVLHYSRC